jgi:nitroreductase
MSYETATMTVTESAEARRSIRAFSPEPVPEDDLREILRVAGLAPSAFNVQPWRWVVVREPELKAQLGAAAYGQKQVTGAPAVIVLYSDMSDALDRIEETVHPGMANRRDEVAKSLRGTWAARTAAERESWGAGQSYIALGYLLLAAQSMGYATSPMLGFDAAAVKRVLGLPEHVTVPALVAIGMPEEEGFPHHRHALDRVATFR